ncbi:hypothetical protein [Hydrogenophaga pseudoflava]|uniref:hypothetical protein n=1 Tax=Hydrogenophaga pseudoflava TaxID=47421 RepID=UPI0027E536AA|nr:hypothetical protein [Hydrogenophaga pseudoflava]MDQ7745467.1 hypothetical protein [Hydrogenophaga pseudoflava]
MSQQSNLAAAFLRVSNAIMALHGRIGTLASLPTTNKTSLVAALTELHGLIGGAGAVIDDGATATGTVWSSTRTQNAITSAITALISGAPSAQDTLGEIAAQITALQAVDAKLLSVGGAQAFTTAEQLQGCQNLGIGDPEHNYTTAINTALTGSGL